MLQEAPAEAQREKRGDVWLLRPTPTDAVETPGNGIAGKLNSHTVAVGKLPDEAVLEPWARGAVSRARLDNAALAWVCVDGEPTGAVLLRDPLRRQASRLCTGASTHALVQPVQQRRQPTTTFSSSAAASTGAASPATRSGGAIPSAWPR